MAIIQITLQHDLTHLWVKCDTEAIAAAAAHYSDILPSGSVPVTQRWTSLLILITTLPTHHEGTQNQAIFNGDENKYGCWIVYHAYHTKCPNSNQWVLYTRHAHNNSMHSEKLFWAVKKYISNYLLLLPLVPSSGLWKVIIIFLSFYPSTKKSPDSFGPYQLQWRENKGVLWNSYSASLKGKLGR